MKISYHSKSLTFKILKSTPLKTFFLFIHLKLRLFRIHVWTNIGSLTFRSFLRTKRQVLKATWTDITRNPSKEVVTTTDLTIAIILRAVDQTPDLIIAVIIHEIIQEHVKDPAQILAMKIRSTVENLHRVPKRMSQRQQT